jgi:hypothetical protein
MQIKSFLKQTFAALAGNTDKVIAEKNYRKATAVIKSQISSLEFQKELDEQAVEDAVEALNDAKYPNTPIGSDGGPYLSKIHECNDILISAKDELAETEKAIAFNQALLAEFDTPVDAE